MTGYEYQAQEIVPDVVVERGVEVRPPRPGPELAAELFVLAGEPRPPAQQVDRTMLRGGHEPGARVVGDARLRPPLEGDDEGVLGQLLREADVAHDPRETRDEAGPLDAKDGVDGAMGSGGRHRRRSHHLQSIVASAAARAAPTSSRPSSPSARDAAPPAPGARE